MTEAAIATTLHGEELQRLRAIRKDIEASLERMLQVLDALDGNPDLEDDELEDGGDDEPALGWHGVSQLRLTAHEDGETRSDGPMKAGRTVSMRNRAATNANLSWVRWGAAGPERANRLGYGAATTARRWTSTAATSWTSHKTATMRTRRRKATRALPTSAGFRNRTGCASTMPPAKQTAAPLRRLLRSWTKVPGAVGKNGINNVRAFDGQEFIRLSNGTYVRFGGRAG